MTDKNETVIALLGQPNSGKSTLFNALTGLRQHVGNWPGKTVEKKEGRFTHNGKEYLVADLPGTYSLSANSDEEMITRDYIASGKADVVCILADSSQLERSLYMLADYAGITVPCFLVLNMSDVAADQGKKVDASALEKKLGIPVVLLSAPNTKAYDGFYSALERAVKDKTSLNAEALEKRFEELDTYRNIKSMIPENVIPSYSATWLATKAVEKDAPVIAKIKAALPDGARSSFEAAVDAVDKGVVFTGERKFAWIDELLEGTVNTKKTKVSLGKFDRLITHHIWGKPVVVLTIVLGLIASFIPALPFMGIGQAIGKLPDPLNEALLNIGCPAFLAAIICDVILRCLSFIIQMLGFVFGVVVLFTDAGAFLAVNIPGTIITCIMKGMCAGIAAGILYKLISAKSRFLAVLVAGVAAPVVNTGLFLLGCVLFFMDTINEWATASGFPSAGNFLIFGMVGANFFVELIINLALSTAIVQIIGIAKKSNVA